MTEVKDTIESPQQLIELVRTEQNGDLPTTAEFTDPIDRNFLPALVQTPSR